MLDEPTTPVIDVSSIFTEQELQILELYTQDLAKLNKLKNPLQRKLFKSKIFSTFGETLKVTTKDIENHAIMLSAPQTEDSEAPSISIAELMNTRNVIPDWIVPNLIRSGGGLFIASGIPKTGKTLIFCYHLAYAVATGTPFLGFPVTKGKVLIFQCEESKVTITSRLAAVGLDQWGPYTQEVFDNKSIQVEFNFTLGSDFDKLRDLVKEYSPSLVIFDSFRSITSGLDISENSADISKSLYSLQKMLNVLGVTGVVIHHNKKDSRDKGAEGMSGSLAIAGANDGMFLLYPNKESSTYKHIVDIETIPRDGYPISITVEKKIDENGYRFFDLIEERNVDPNLINSRKRILRYLSSTAGTPINKKDLANKIGTATTDANYNFALEQLVESMQIVRARVDQHTFEYWLPPNSPWAKLDKTGYSQEFDHVDQLLRASSRAEILSLKNEWDSTFGKEYMHSIWNLLTDQEEEKILSIYNPRAFDVQQWVRDKESKNIHQITEYVYDAQLRSWMYKVEDRPEMIKEDDLEVDLNYVDYHSSV